MSHSTVHKPVTPGMGHPRGSCRGARRASNRVSYISPWTQNPHSEAGGGRLSNLRADKLSTPAYSLQTLDYQYDAGGNVTQILKNNLEQHSYTYDSLSQLTYWDSIILPYYPLDSEPYTYSSVTGNLDSKDGVTCNYGDAAHKHAVTSTTDNRQFTYDANGNMVSRTVNGTSYTLAYDAENRLTGVTWGTNSAAFLYDGDGNRVTP